MRAGQGIDHPPCGLKPGHPARPMQSLPTAGLLARGSVPMPPSRVPHPVARDIGSPLTVAGAAPAGEGFAPASLLISRLENRRANRYEVVAILSITAFAMSLPHLTLVLGGARSGKSRWAEALVTAEPGPWTYLATAQAFDAEMEERIAEHRARRAAGWATVEAPLALAEAVSREGARGNPMLIDCLTLWLSNVMLAGHEGEPASDALEAAVVACRTPIVAVSNEVGLGIVPETPLGRRFRDAQGRLNQRMAATADRVVLMVAGLPLQVK